MVQSAALNPSDDGQRTIVIAVDPWDELSLGLSYPPRSNPGPVPTQSGKECCAFKHFVRGL